MLICIPQTLFGEIEQRVRVMEYIPHFSQDQLSADKKPLPLVEVNVQGASSTVTDHNGECKLLFKNKEGGDRIVFRFVSRSGYQLKDPDMLNDLVIRRDNEPIVILMMSQENVIKLDHYLEDIVGSQFRKQRDREVNSLDRNAADFEKRKQEIIDKYEAKMDDAEQYISRLVQVDMSNLSDNEQKSFSAFREGDLNKAISYLEESNLVEKYKQANLSLQKVKDAHEKVEIFRQGEKKRLDEIMSNLQWQVTLLEMEGSVESFNKVLKLLENMLSIDQTGNFQVKEYIELILEIGHFHKADSAMRASLKNPDLTPFRRCRISSCLAVILAAQNRYDEAWDFLKKIETLQMEVLKENPSNTTMLFHLLTDQHILGDICISRNQYDEAVMHYLKMYDAYRSLRQADSKPKFYANVSYKRLNQALEKLYFIGRNVEADSIYNETFPRAEKYFSQGSIKERMIVIQFQKTHLNRLLALGKHDQAMNLMESMLPDLEYIYGINKPMSESIYQQILRNLARYYYLNKQYDKSIKSFDKWRDVRDYVENSDLYSIDSIQKVDNDRVLSELLSVKAYCLNMLDHPEQAADNYREAIRVIEESPQIYQRYSKRLGTYYANLSQILLDLNKDLDSALEFAERALQFNPDSETAKDVYAKLKKK